MRQQLLERQPSLRRMPPFQELLDGRVRRRPMHVQQGIEQRRQP